MHETDAPAALPSVLAEIRKDFLDLQGQDRLQLLLEFSRELPDIPDRFKFAPGLLERVEECQSPIRSFAEINSDRIVHLYATAPEEAPTTRGFASILAQGLDGLTPEQVLTIPDDFPTSLGLEKVVSPLRLRGMSGILQRAKRQLREQLDARESATTDTPS